MDREDLINTCALEQFQVLLFSDLKGPLMLGMGIAIIKFFTFVIG